MLPFHALLFRVRVIVEGPCFIASDDSLQEGLSFFVRPIKEFPGNIKAFLLVLRREHLGYPATPHLRKFEHFSDYVMSCTCGYIQMLGYFSTVILLSARIKSLTACCFSGVFTSEGLPCMGSSLILIRPSLNLSIHLYTFLWFKQLLPYWTDILVSTSLSFSPSAARNLITALCSSCIASSKGEAILKN